MKRILDRFLNYVTIDTQSISGLNQYPSTEKQKNLGKILVDELINMGITDAHIDEYGYVYATIPSNIDNKSIPSIGFISHMDTAPNVSGKDVKAKVIKNYNGKDIILNKDKNITLKISDYPRLPHYTGKDIVVTDGTTLLGADDKAGIAEIMYMAETLMTNSDIKHGTVKIAFTPDEEVGRGTDFFDVEKFGADFAYTMDGGELGEFYFENFNAATATVIIRGKSAHTGYAKNRMINSTHISIKFHSMLPELEVPANTENYEGFTHLDSLNGNIEETIMNYVVRDHDMNKFNLKKERLFKIAAYLNELYGEDTVMVETKDLFYNMKEKVLPHYHIIEKVLESMKELNVEPIVIPVRGGTDGAKLSYRGLPCPNIFMGGDNSHSRFEYICIQSMEKAGELILKIIQKYASEK